MEFNHYLEALEAQENSLTEGAVLEFLGMGKKDKVGTPALNMKNAAVSQLSKKDFPELKGEVYTLSTRSPIIADLATMLGVPEDGTAVKIRTGYVCLDTSNKLLYFSTNKLDLPAYISKRPKGYVKEEEELDEEKSSKVSRNEKTGMYDVDIGGKTYSFHTHKEASTAAKNGMLHSKENNSKKGGLQMMKGDGKGMEKKPMACDSDEVDAKMAKHGGHKSKTGGLQVAKADGKGMEKKPMADDMDDVHDKMLKKGKDATGGKPVLDKGKHLFNPDKSKPSGRKVKEDVNEAISREPVSAELAKKLDDLANGTDEIKYQGKRYVRKGPENPTKSPGPWRLAESVAIDEEKTSGVTRNKETGMFDVTVGGKKYSFHTRKEALDASQDGAPHKKVTESEYTLSTLKDFKRLLKQAQDAYENEEKGAKQATEALRIYNGLSASDKLAVDKDELEDLKHIKMMTESVELAEKMSPGHKKHPGDSDSVKKNPLTGFFEVTVGGKTYMYYTDAEAKRTLKDGVPNKSAKETGAKEAEGKNLFNPPKSKALPKMPAKTKKAADEVAEGLGSKITQKIGDAFSPYGGNKVFLVDVRDEGADKPKSFHVTAKTKEEAVDKMKKQFPKAVEVKFMKRMS